MGSQLSDRIVDVHGISPIVQAQKGGVGGVKDGAGWWTRNDEGKLLYLFTAGGLREALKGHDFEAALKVLASVGALPPPNAKGEYAKTVRISGVKPSRVYEINPEKLEDARS